MSRESTGTARKVDVVIIGAGPVGMAAGILLGRFGIDTVVLERRTDMSAHPRSRAVSCRTMEVFRGLGLADQVRGAALPGSPTRFLGKDAVSPWTSVNTTRVSAPGELDTELGPESLGVVLCSQDVLEPILLEAVTAQDSVQLLFGTNVEHIEQGDSGVVLTARDANGPVTIEARYVIAADGSLSPTRSALGIDVTGDIHLQTAVSVMFRSPLIEKRTGDPSGFIYLNNPDTIGAVVIAPVDADGRAAMLGRPLVMDRIELDQIDWVQEIRSAIGDPEESIEIIGVGLWTVGAWVADSYQKGRVFLAGDAVHVMPPYGGFNQNTGIQDVHNLAWKLAGVIAGWADPELLTSYETERQPVARFNMREAVENFRSIIGNESSGTRTFRPENFDHPGLDIGFRYEVGAVSPQGDGAANWPVGDFVPSAAVGERAPHVWLDSSRSTSTLDLFGCELVVMSRAGSGPAARVLEAAQSSGIPCRAVTFGAGDDHEEAMDKWAESYSVSGDTAILVRPDGHVLARLDDTEPSGIDDAIAAYTGVRSSASAASS